MSLQSTILDYLKTIPKCWAVKVMTANFRGCPDILICHRGKFIAIEVKEGKDQISPIQDAQLELIVLSDGRVCVARSLNDVKKLFREKGRGYHGKDKITEEEN